MLLPYQIQANREKRDWSQAILGKKADMKQNAISRLESMDYGNLTINTLLRLAYGFDCGLLVKFVPFSRLVREFEDVSPTGLEVEGFDDDRQNLQAWALNVKTRHTPRDQTKSDNFWIQPSLFDATVDVSEGVEFTNNILSDDIAENATYFHATVQDFTARTLYPN